MRKLSDNTLIAKESIKEAVNGFLGLNEITLENTKGKVTYRILEKNCDYQGHQLKLYICYLETLKSTKEKAIVKAIGKEAEAIAKISRSLAKLEFACEEDAHIEVSQLKAKDFKKVGYHDISFELKAQEIHRRGRPSKETSSNIEGYKYIIEVTANQNEMSIKQAILENCCFVLCSNDCEISGETMLREHKTQDCVEKKFQQLKSPQFVNSIYLESY